MITNNLYTTVKYFSLACVMLVFASCSDNFFNVEVGERITPDQHYKDYIDAQTSFYGTLVPLQDVAANAVLVDGLRSDQMVLTENANTDLLEIGSLNMRAENPFLDASGYYKTIINVNEVLSKIQSAADRDRAFLDGELFDMRATLYGLRAWCYLNVVRNYGEVNWMDDNMTKLPEVLDGNKLSKTELLDTLINQFVADSIVYEGRFGRTEYVYAYFPNYKAVLGELYLEKGDYANAVKYLKLGMESVPNKTVGLGDLGDLGGVSSVYKVTNDYSELKWFNIFYNAENQYKENIGVIPYSINDNQPNPIVQYFLPTDLYMVKPAKQLVDSFETAVPTGTATMFGDINRGILGTYGYTSYDSVTMATGNNTYINKYSLDVNDPYSSDVILQRAGEVHLLLAEALNRAGRSDVALMLMNRGIFNEMPLNRPGDFGYWTQNQGIRGRARLTARVVPDSIEGRPITDMEKVDMIEDWIIEEKAMECAFEGHRMSDLIRVASRRDNPGEYIGSLIARKYSDPAKQAQVKTYYMDRKNWYLPK
jgi:starch-binding outer membrane protein, SusD/RagB family